MRFSRKNLGIPYMLFLILFVIAPLAVLFYYAFTNGSGQFTLMNFIGFFTNPNTVGTLFYSLAIAAVTTIVCVLLAYPLAYILATSHFRAKSVIVMIFVMPMWINFSLRITALKEVLTFLEGNLAMHPFLNAVIGMSYDFLPFMILPIYTTISRLDHSLLEAAADLGADEKTAFWKVTLPLSMPGVASGITMVFVPSVSTFIISRMLGGGTNMLIGDLIDLQFLGNAYNPNLGAAISLVLMVFIFLCMSITNQLDNEDMEGVLL